MESFDTRPDQEVLADVVRRGTDRVARQRRRRRGFGGAATIVALGLIGAVLVARAEDPPAERVDSVASSAVPAVAVDPGFEVRAVMDAGADDKPPSVRIGNADHLLELNAWTTCWNGGGRSYCADGFRHASLERIDGAAEVYVEFPLEGWEFESSAVTGNPDDRCGRRFSQQLEQVAPTVFRLPPMGPPGDYTVDVFGRGDGGDVIVRFAWTTGVTGSFAKPASTLSLLADNDGAVDSYGVEFSVINLDRTPTDVTAEVEVTASNGESQTIQLVPRGEPCGEGTLNLTAPTEDGLAAAALGDPPFTYEVSLTLDGITHEATATWPDDEDEECAPCVPLVFDPSLTGLGD